MRRRPATAAEARALGNPLRLRIIRLCNQRELTNKQLADRLDRDPATVLRHVRILVDAGFLEPVAPRRGPSGALEKPYRSTGLSWWLSHDEPLRDPIEQQPLVAAFLDELHAAGASSIEHLSRFHLHLDGDELGTFLTELMELLDRWMETDAGRRDAGSPAYGGLAALHRLADAASDAAPGDGAGRDG